MSENKKQQAQKVQKSKIFNKEISSLDIDKREYQEIVLSHSNFPDRDYFKQNYYD
jgi:hypothetical protein